MQRAISTLISDEDLKRQTDASILVADMYINSTLTNSTP